MTRIQNKLVVHDYSGHPGQVDLSRALARDGYVVVHQHCPSYVTGKGSLQALPGDPPTFTIEPCSLKSEFNKYEPGIRILQEIKYGFLASERIIRCQPDAAILSNIPLMAHAIVAARLRIRRIPMIFWHQDIYSIAIGAFARKRFPIMGVLVAWAAQFMESTIARVSHAIVPISETFVPVLKRWGVVEQRITVIPNWAPIADLPVSDKVNTWGDRHGLSSSPVVLYSGTLGEKHDPSILAAIASHLEEFFPDARLVVVSQGKGRQWLEEWNAKNGCDQLVLLDYQSYEDLPLMMGTADLLLAILEPEASEYSVPSKVLTYLCSERPSRRNAQYKYDC